MFALVGSVVVVVRCRCIVVVVVDVVVVAGGSLLLGAVTADHALADRHSLVEAGVVDLVRTVLAPVPHQPLKPMTPQHLARQIRCPRLQCSRKRVRQLKKT